MVEPAIAITAMNIATLRPMFKNFFKFASKRFDHSVGADSRQSADSQEQLRTRANQVNANHYSVEFAELLGLSRVGVTTMITAGGSEEERRQMRKRIKVRAPSRMREKPDNESQMELSPVPQLDLESGDWMAGIKATTVVTQSHD